MHRRGQVKNLTATLQSGGYLPQNVGFFILCRTPIVECHWVRQGGNISDGEGLTAKILCLLQSANGL